ncbi:MAG: YebC/PmpR family DNA-binding transcriptional regulator [Ardenticatenaceae bacterium]|nr:YebC/PmpR family DNA-binding transcriptional regulator [Anaerolineales bacterium]MCB8922638.1 YebC/PmpR family DNA-binding transcriptional regulator [Ardenticatenaceae bacterium]MCB9003654.1 YebC/PmpR family DNA-binding transcriptional regulator [Ardenticatenaceae bacterium]
MSGHSKWSTIKHKKAAVDAKRGKLFTRLAKEITIAAREGGGDPAFNNRLGLAVDKAKAANMPKDNIDRAIKRGTGELEGLELVENVYEAYGPHGVGIIVEVVTDNRNRAVADLRHALSKNGGSLAESGSVAWQFTRKGYINITEKVDQDELFLVAADAGADDVQFSETAEIYVDIDYFQAVQKALEEAEIKADEASLIYDPNTPMELGVSETMQVMRLIEKLEDLDDVQNVYSALDITDEAIAEMEEAE